MHNTNTYLDHVLTRFCHLILFKSKGKSDVLLHLNAATALRSAAHTSWCIHPQHPCLPSGLRVQQHQASGCCMQVRPHVRLALDIDSCHQAYCIAAQAEVAQRCSSKPHPAVLGLAYEAGVCAVKVLGIAANARVRLCCTGH